MVRDMNSFDSRKGVLIQDLSREKKVADAVPSYSPELGVYWIWPSYKKDDFEYVQLSQCRPLFSRADSSIKADMHGPINDSDLETVPKIISS